jgi:hypothetical protein
MDSHVSLVQMGKYGIQLIAFVNALLDNNGTVLLVLHLVRLEWLQLMDFAHALQVPILLTEHVLDNQLVLLVKLGVGFNV